MKFYLEIIFYFELKILENKMFKSTKATLMTSTTAIKLQNCKYTIYFED